MATALFQASAWGLSPPRHARLGPVQPGVKPGGKPKGESPRLVRRLAFDGNYSTPFDPTVR
jgi:hypothetical protein